MERPNAGSDPKISGWTKRNDSRTDDSRADDYRADDNRADDNRADDNRADDNQLGDRGEKHNDMREHSPHTENDPLGPAPTAGPMTPAIKTLQPADAPIGEPGENEEDRLDEALQESMGTSDPVSIKIA